ncbi:hypothetical protein CHCC15381_3936 [Bacillus paralicheniformis]|uniref:Uncharacterized protein n=1 Tax=Bacillus paralicheniformis TaxID=1648923 RepID=A0ABY3FYG4_9BACI|nr:hypothetical protein CHCC15381_3936 [Bacillus paralicheniformis]
MMQIGYFPLNPNHQIEQSGHIDLRDGRSVNRWAWVFFDRTCRFLRRNGIV